MPRAAYPVGTDVIVFVQSTSVVTANLFNTISQLQFNNAAIEALTKFKNESGREFLAPAATTRLFDPPWTNPRGFLDLRDDVINVTSVTINGSPQTFNQDYFLWPPNADVMGKPWNGIELQRNFPNFYLPNQRKSVAVTGQWAYSTLIPDDVFSAIVKLAALSLVPFLSLNISGGLQASKTPNSEYQFGQGVENRPVVREAKMWELSALTTLKDYTRRAVGLGIG